MEVVKDPVRCEVVKGPARMRRSFRRGGVVGCASIITLEGRHWPMSGDTEEPRRLYWLTMVAWSVVYVKLLTDVEFTEWYG